MKRAFLLTALTLLGQDATIRVNVNLIQVDVTVEDKSGKRVPDLTAEDFEVFRDGKRQAIQSVLWVPGTRSAAPTTAESPTGPQPVRALKPQEVRRTIALLVDDLSLSPSSSYYARQALEQFVDKNIAPGDLVALFSTSSGLGMMQQFTTNKQQLLSQIRGIRLRNMNGVDALAPIVNNPNEDSSDPTIAQMAMEERLRDEINQRERQDMITAGMLSSVQVVVRGLKELPGRKSLILFSESIQLADPARAMTNPGMTPAMMQMPGAMGGTRGRTLNSIRSLIDGANRSGVVLYTIDPRGLVYNGMTAADAPSGNTRRMMGQMQQRQMDLNMSQDGMAMLAEETGGLFYRNTNDLAAALNSALEDQSGYYLISFKPDDETFEKAKSSPRYHSLAVKLKRGGLKVRYRKGFFGVSDEPDTRPSAPILQAMVSPFKAVELPLKLTPIFLSDAAGKPMIRALVHIDPSAFKFSPVPAEPADKNQEPWQQAAVDQLVILFDQYGQQVDQIAKTHLVKLRGDGYRRVLKSGLTQEIEMPVAKPGPYQLRTAVQDKASNKAGSATQFIEIPDIGKRQLIMSDLVVSSEGWLERNEIEGGPAQRIIRPGAKLSYAALVYNAKQLKGATKPNLETQVILYRDGKPVYTGKKTPFQPEGYLEGQSLSIAGGMQLGVRSAPGEYVLEVAVRDLEAPKKHQFFVRSLEFEVRP